MATKVQNQLTKISKSLSDLSKKVEVLRDQLTAAPAKKVAPKKVVRSAKKAKATAGGNKPTVLETVFDVVRRSRKGVTIATLKEKTGLEARQLSNALYKLSKRGQVVAKSRGVYVKK
jgi:lambda repressor-like predicted transcriptional regulator